MKEKFEEVLSLQLEHSSLNTPAMVRRGQLIRDEIPAEMRTWPAAASNAALPFKGRLNVQGRDGTGLKTFVPWVRIHSPELSPSAQSGWYVVYLFRQDGSAVALCISHGSTRFDGGDFKPRSSEEAAILMSWGRGLIADDAAALGFEPGVDLGSNEKLSRAYERTTAFSKPYSADALPSDGQLERDARNAVALLGLLYRAVELGRAPEASAPEVVAANAAVTAIARPAPDGGPGQGFGLSAQERRLIEEHAMAAAFAWLHDTGFERIRDVHLTHSCDFIAQRNGVEHFIEVKGTTASLGSILLTANEVALHRSAHPHNILLVLHNIDLLEMRTKATGGTLHVSDPWDAATAQLTPLSYSCNLLVDAKSS